MGKGRCNWVKGGVCGIRAATVYVALFRLYGTHFSTLRYSSFRLYGTHLFAMVTPMNVLDAWKFCCPTRFYHLDFVTSLWLLSITFILPIEGKKETGHGQAHLSSLFDTAVVKQIGTDLFYFFSGWTTPSPIFLDWTTLFLSRLDDVSSEDSAPCLLCLCLAFSVACPWDVWLRTEGWKYFLPLQPPRYIQ